MRLNHSPTLGYANVFPLRVPEWEDIRVSIGNVTLPAVQKPTWTDYKGGKVLAFADQGVEANEERVFFVIQVPHAYEEGTDIEPHVHWVGEDQTAGDVVWKLSCSWASMAAAFPGESTYYSVAGNNAALADAHIYSEFSPSIDGSGQGVSSMMICSLRRNSNNSADTFNSKDAYLLEFDVHFKKNTLGSQTLTAK